MKMGGSIGDLVSDPDMDQVATAYGVRGVPTTVLIDRNGIVRRYNGLDATGRDNVVRELLRAD